MFETTNDSQKSSNGAETPAVAGSSLSLSLQRMSVRHYLALLEFWEDEESPVGSVVEFNEEPPE